MRLVQSLPFAPPGPLHPDPSRTPHLPPTHPSLFPQLLMSSERKLSDTAATSTPTPAAKPEPRQKRHQVPRACAYCALKHSSCSETRPCTRCVAHGLECVERPRKRRRAPEGYSTPPTSTLPYSLSPPSPGRPGPSCPHPLPIRHGGQLASRHIRRP